MEGVYSMDRERKIYTEVYMTLIRLSKDLIDKIPEELKQTIIMITHNLEIAKMADRIIKIEDGKIVSEA